MMFPNAFSGVKKIKVGQILALIATIALVVAVILVLAKGEGFYNEIANADDLTDEQAVDVAKGLAPSLILMLIYGIISIVAMIVTLVGLNRARIDEPAFMTALILVILSLVVSAVNTFALTDKYETASKFASAAQTVLQLASTLFIIKGCMNLAGKLDRPDMIAKGKRTMTVILVVSIVAIVCEILTGFFSLGETLANVVSVIDVCASVLSVVYLIIYIVYLGKAQKMLEA